MIDSAQNSDYKDSDMNEAHRAAVLALGRAASASPETRDIQRRILLRWLDKSQPSHRSRSARRA